MIRRLKIISGIDTNIRDSNKRSSDLHNTLETAKSKAYHWWAFGLMLQFLNKFRAVGGVKLNKLRRR